MANRLQDKKVLITAAGQGIGKAIAVACASEGAQVLATDIDRQLLEAVHHDHPEIEVEQLDVTDSDNIERIAGLAGNIDVLVNCAGHVHHGTILDCAPEDWEQSFALNVTPVFQLIRRLLPAMLDSGGGNIINISSVASSITGVPNRFVYGTTKAAIIGLTKAVAADFVGKGIRCNAICPGTVESPSLQQRMRSQGDYETAREAFVSRQPMGRIGKPSEVASLAVYLASDESAYTTGAIHIIDGGWCI